MPPVLFWELRRMDAVTWELVGVQRDRHGRYPTMRATVASVNPEARTITGTDGEVYSLEDSECACAALLWVAEDLRLLGEAVA